MSGNISQNNSRKISPRTKKSSDRCVKNFFLIVGTVSALEPKEKFSIIGFIAEWRTQNVHT